MIDRSRQVSANDGVFILEDGHAPDDPRLRRLTSPVSHHPTFWEFASQSPVADVAADVCGPDVKFYQSKLNFKWPKGGQLFDWHHDIPAWPHTDYSPVTIGLYLDDCGEAQGPLQAVRGSHNESLRSMYDDDGDWVLRIPEEKMPENWRENTVSMTGPAGSLVLVNCRVIHGSARNASDRMRPLLLNVFSSADSFPERLRGRDRQGQSRPPLLPRPARLRDAVGLVPRLRRPLAASAAGKRGYGRLTRSSCNGGQPRVLHRLPCLASLDVYDHNRGRREEPTTRTFAP
jgi:hypothetical protein